MRVEGAKRLSQLPPYLFARIEQLKEAYEAAGGIVTDLSVGDPNFPTEQSIVEALKQAVDVEDHHHYPPFRGYQQLRQAIVDWYKSRFNVELDVEKEVLVLLGSKEGLSHISMALLDPGDLALVPNPGYPAYAGGISLAGGRMVQMPLLAENQFFPDLEGIDEEAAKQAKLMFLNYPNNPTGSVARREDFERVVSFAKQHQIVVVHDAAYSEVSFGDYRCPSFLQASGAKEVGVEFHSFSKTFCMTGWRVGMVVGNAEVIAHLGKIKAFVDSGVFGAVQVAATKALEGFERIQPEIKAAYERRIHILTQGLACFGWHLEPPRAGYFVWAKVPDGITSMEFCEKMLQLGGVLITPGHGFGEYGEGYVRISLNVTEEELHQATNKIGPVYQSLAQGRG